MVDPALLRWLGLFAVPAAVLVFAHVARGLRRGWFHRRDGVSRIRRDVDAAIFWFEVGVSLGLAGVLSAIGALGLIAWVGTIG